MFIIPTQIVSKIVTKTAAILPDSLKASPKIVGTFQARGTLKENITVTFSHRPETYRIQKPKLMDSTMALNNIISFPDNSSIHTANPKLVHGFLATIISEQDPDLIIESNKHQFMVTATPTIKTSNTVTITINDENIIGSPDHIDFYVTSTIENQQGETTICTLYLNLRSGNSEVNIFKNGFIKHPKDTPLVMDLRDGNEHLTDSIFELNLHKIDAKGTRHFIGHGKGYLLFQNDTVTKSKMKDVA